MQVRLKVHNCTKCCSWLCVVYIWIIDYSIACKLSLKVQIMANYKNIGKEKNLQTLVEKPHFLTCLR